MLGQDGGSFRVRVKVRVKLGEDLGLRSWSGIWLSALWLSQLHSTQHMVCPCMEPMTANPIAACRAAVFSPAVLTRLVRIRQAPCTHLSSTLIAELRSTCTATVVEAPTTAVHEDGSTWQHSSIASAKAQLTGQPKTHLSDARLGCIVLHRCGCMIAHCQADMTAGLVEGSLGTCVGSKALPDSSCQRNTFCTRNRYALYLRDPASS